jgi:hypothetical protein
MSYREQKKYFEDLERFERKFDSREREMFKILKQRHKDDEDLDKLSMGKLKELHEKYYVNRKKPDLSGLFKDKEE